MPIHFHPQTSIVAYLTAGDPSVVANRDIALDHGPASSSLRTSVRGEVFLSHATKPLC